MPIPRDGTVAWIPMPGEAVTTRDHTPSLGRIPTQTRRESPLWGDIIKVISSLLFPFFFFLILAKIPYSLATSNRTVFFIELELFVSS